MPDRRFTPRRKPTGIRQQAMLVFVMAVLLAGSLLMLWPPKQSITRGMALHGGTTVILQAEKSDQTPVSYDDMLAAKAILDKRLDLINQMEVTVQVLGFDRLLVQIPGEVDTAFVLSVIGTAGVVEFIDVKTAVDQVLIQSVQNNQAVSRSYMRALGLLSTMPDTPPAAALFLQDDDKGGGLYGGDDEAHRYSLPIVMYYNPMTYAQLPIASIRSIGVWKPAALEAGAYAVLASSKNVTSATATVDNSYYYADYRVRVTLDDETFAVISDPGQGYVATNGVMILIDGYATTTRIASSNPKENTVTLSGGLSETSSVALGVILETGALPVSVKTASSQVGSLLGYDIIVKALTATAIGLVVLFVYLAFCYRGLGLLAIVAMVVYATLTLGILALLSFYHFFTLTISAAAGVVLTSALAADSTILILERIKEEVRLGRAVRVSAANALSRAVRSSIESEVALLISGIAVYIIDTGLLKGFGLALTIGVASDILKTVFFTAPVIRLLSGEQLAKRSAFWGLKQDELTFQASGQVTEGRQ